MLTALALVLALGVRPARADAPQRDEDDESSPWHVDVDVGYGRSKVRFVVPASFAGACEPVTTPPEVPPEALPAPPTGCTLPETTVDLLRGTLGVGHGGFTFEGSVQLDRRALAGESGGPIGPYLAWSAGVRLETSWTGLFALSFRFAYVRRETRGLEGDGGRASIGTLIRLTPWLVVYGEAAIDLTGVPGWMEDGGVLLAYTTWFGGGLRFEFGH